MIHVHAEAVRSIKSAAEGMHRFLDMLSGPGQIYLILTGLGCIAYYCLILVYTRRWHSTFSWFWALSGSFHLIVYALYPFLCVQIRLLIGIVLAAAWMTASITGAKIVCAMNRKEIGEVEYLIILGAQVRGTRITNSLMRRLDCAYSYLIKHPDTKVIVSGGQGKGESITEAKAMAENLIQRGVRESNIFQEVRSTSTLENLRYSMEYIGCQELSVAVVTSDFHLYRALLLGKYVGYRNLTGIAAASNPVLFLNYLVREIIAVSVTKISICNHV